MSGKRVSAKRGDEIDTLYDAAAAFLEGAGFKPVVIGGTTIQRRADAASEYHNELVIKFLGGKKKPRTSRQGSTRRAENIR